MGLRFKDVFEDIPMKLDWSINPYGQKLTKAITEDRYPVLFGSLLKGKKGRWIQYVKEQGHLASEPKKLFLEVGCHKGLCLSLMAKDHPDSAFLGVDFTLKRSFLTAQRLAEKKLNNAFSVLADARLLEQFVAPAELDGVILFFPDPWLKRSQSHNQLVNQDFCEKLYKLIKDGGFVWVKTDQQSYFDGIQKSMRDVGFTKFELQNPQLSENLYDKEYVSHFEGMYRGRDLSICQAVWKKLPISTK